MESIKNILWAFIILQIPFNGIANHKVDSLINIVRKYEQQVHHESDTN